MDQVRAHCMSPNNAEIPLAAVYNVLVEPVQHAAFVSLPDDLLIEVLLFDGTFLTYC